MVHALSDPICQALICRRLLACTACGLLHCNDIDACVRTSSCTFRHALIVTARLDLETLKERAGNFCNCLTRKAHSLHTLRSIQQFIDDKAGLICAYVMLLMLAALTNFQEIILAASRRTDTRNRTLGAALLRPHGTRGLADTLAFFAEPGSSP